MPLGTEVGLGPGHVVLDGDLSFPKKGTAASNFADHDYYGQPAEWIRMPLSSEVGLGQGDIVHIPLFSYPYYQLSKLCHLTVILHSRHRAGNGALRVTMTQVTH